MSCASIPYGGLCGVFKQTALIVILLTVLALAAGPARAADKAVITVLGDSLSAGYGLARREAFPAQLERALGREGYNVEIRNAGVSGDTAEDGAARLDWAVGRDVRGVIVELGANDALRGHTPERMRKALREILTGLKARKIHVLLAGMKAPRNMGSEYIAAYDRVFPDLAGEFGVGLIPFFLENVAAKPALNLADGLHPNPRGVAEIVRNALPHVRTLLDGMGMAAGNDAAK